MLAKTDPFNKRNKNGTSPQYIDITVISSTNMDGLHAS